MHPTPYLEARDIEYKIYWLCICQKRDVSIGCEAPLIVLPQGKNMEFAYLEDVHFGFSFSCK